MLAWLVYPLYLICLLTGVLALQMFWTGGTLTVISGVLALGGAIWAAWYTATLPRRQRLWPAWISDFILISLWVMVVGLAFFQRLVLRYEHGPALDSFDVGMMALMPLLLLVMAAAWWMVALKLRARE
ncbi:hypothetical protein [Deinococcus sp.]|uniref:hypothetical protein n=1 Tax=Deinococcus sp. TaxID=47478 RepID=UPI003B5C822C